LRLEWSGTNVRLSRYPKQGGQKRRFCIQGAIMVDTLKENSVAQFWHRLSNEPIVMFTDMFTGGLRSRPMASRAREDEGVIWFLTDRESAKVDEVLANSSVALAVVDVGANLYMSVTGTCKIFDNAEKIAELWSPADKLFFDGPDDPRIVLLCVAPSEGQTWSGPSGPVAAMKVAFSILTGTKAEIGTAEKVKL
jgi:general stress protein 26